MKQRSFELFMPCNIYVDAQNIRIALEEMGVSDEFDPRHLVSLLDGQVVGGRPLVAMRIFIYNTIDAHASEEELAREQRYLDRLERLPDVQVVAGRTAASGHQKGVDVQLAVDALTDAFSGRVGVIVIASGDGDFRPLVESVRRFGPHVIVMSFEKTLSSALREAADRVILLPEKPDGWEMKD